MPFYSGKAFFNFDTVVKKFIDAQATLVIGKNDLSTFGFDFFNDKDIRERLKLNAIKVVDENKEALLGDKLITSLNVLIKY